MIDNRLEITIVSREQYIQLIRAGQHKSSDPIFENAQGTSAWQALQNVVNKNGKRIFTESDIHKIDKQLKRKKIDVRSGTVNLNECIIDAGLEHKLDALLAASGAAMQTPAPTAKKPETIQAQQTTTAEKPAAQVVKQSEPEAEVVGTAQVEQTAAKPEPVVQQSANPITRLFNIARMADKKPDDVATYDLNKDGTIDLDEQLKAIKKIKQENSSAGSKKLSKGDTNTAEEISMVEDLLALDSENGFYYAQGKSKKARNAEKAKARILDDIKNQRRDANQYARTILNGINNSELNNMLKKAKAIGNGDIQLTATQNKVSTEAETTQPTSNAEASATQNVKQAQPNVIEGVVKSNRGMINVGGKTYKVDGGRESTINSELHYSYDKDTGKITLTGEHAIIKAANGQDDNVEIKGKGMLLYTGDGDDTIVVNGKQTGIEAGTGKDTVIANGDGFGTPVEVGLEDDTIINNGENFFFTKGNEPIDVPQAQQPSVAAVQNESVVNPSVVPSKAETVDVAQEKTSASVSEPAPLEPSFEDVNIALPEAVVSSVELEVAQPESINIDALPLSVPTNEEVASVPVSDIESSAAEITPVDSDAVVKAAQTDKIEYIPSASDSPIIKRPKKEESNDSLLSIDMSKIAKPDFNVEIQPVAFDAEVPVVDIGELNIPEEINDDEAIYSTVGMTNMFPDPFEGVSVDSLSETEEPEVNENNTATQVVSTKGKGNSIRDFFNNFKFGVDFTNPTFATRSFNFATDGLVKPAEESTPRLVRREKQEPQLVPTKPNLGFDAQEIVFNQDTSIAEIEVDGKTYVVTNEDKSGRENRFYYGVNEEGQTVFYGRQVKVASTRPDDNNVNFQVMNGTFLANNGNDTITNSGMFAHIELGDGKKVVNNTGHFTQVTGADSADTINDTTKTLSVNGGKSQAEIKEHQAKIATQVNKVYNLMTQPQLNVDNLRKEIDSLVEIVDGEDFAIGTGRDPQKDALNFSGDSRLTAAGVNELGKKFVEGIKLANTHKQAGLQMAYDAINTLIKINKVGYPISPNPLSDEVILRYNSNTTEEIKTEVVTALSRGMSVDTFMKSDMCKHLLALAAVGKKMGKDVVNFYPSRNPEADIHKYDGMNMPAGASPEFINSVYVRLAEGFNSNDTAKIRQAVEDLSWAHHSGCPTQPHALTATQVSNFQQKEAAYNQIVAMLQEGKTGEEIIKSPVVHKLIQFAKEGINIRFHVERDESDDVPSELAVSDTHSVEYLTELYDKLMVALSKGKLDETKMVLNSLARLQLAGYPISPKYATDAQLAAYNNQYQNRLDYDFNNDTVRRYYNSGVATNAPASGNFARIAGRIAQGIARSTENVNRFHWFPGQEKEVAEPNADTTRQTILCIDDKKALDSVSMILKTHGGIKSDNPIEYVITTYVPEKFRAELYQHLAKIDPYFRRICMEKYPPKTGQILARN